jgi:hypothetical protein
MKIPCVCAKSKVIPALIIASKSTATLPGAMLSCCAMLCLSVSDSVSTSTFPKLTLQDAVTKDSRER